MGDTAPLLDRSRRAWVPVRCGESGDHIFRREDDLAFAKVATSVRSAELAGERDRLLWLNGQGIACPEVIDWRESEEGSCLVMSAVPGVPAAELSGSDLLHAWPAIVGQLRALHELEAARCPFDRGLALMINRARDVVARNAVNPDFLADEDKTTPHAELLARVARELPLRLEQETAERVVCHGDACMPNIMVDPETLECTGFIDLGRMGTGDRYADLALMVANARESWVSQEQADEAFAMLFGALDIETPDQERLAFYLRLDPLTWG